MENERERERIKQCLDQELEAVVFHKAEEVIRRTHPHSLKGRMAAWWNRELEISLLPIAGAVMLLLLAGALLVTPKLLTKQQVLHSHSISEVSGKRELIEVWNNVYDREVYERRVAQIEAEN
ncbi:hypothetical protein DCC85_05370 [Paenibacillus sp. CAA11]|uniref:hypothetical protein n=1 Tax=Paenibacillus sp. CAA11 TaxID=1532905 RepID=UPI000D3C8836|nr:hypothetical protein [Paenibacillus sp. CAA11]AWB43703.1 hypothetical protein DCC85_05370 [Paenibacillus sp. CAA11]